MKYIFVIDGGTTNLRIYLLDVNCKQVDQYKDDAGVRYTAMDGNNDRLKSSLSKGITGLMQKHEVCAEQVLYCVAFGMITSNLGLYELPHIAAPASIADFHAGMKELMMPDVAPFPIRFIPGLRNFSGRVNIETIGAADMMRGEETEAMGLSQFLPAEDAVFVFPGSHNKFVYIDRQKKIKGSLTSISGELLDALTHHTILSDSVQNGFADENSYRKEAMLAGARANAEGLGKAAFSVRILQTQGKANVDYLRSYLMGIVLQEDIKALQNSRMFKEGQRVYVAGKAILSMALIDLLRENSIAAEAISPEVCSTMGIIGACAIAEYK